MPGGVSFIKEPGPRPPPRHKNEVNRQRHPEIDYYDNDYLVLLTADTVRETEFSDLTHALCDLTVARAQ